MDGRSRQAVAARSRCSRTCVAAQGRWSLERSRVMRRVVAGTIVAVARRGRGAVRSCIWDLGFAGGGAVARRGRGKGRRGAMRRGRRSGCGSVAVRGRLGRGQGYRSRIGGDSVAARCCRAVGGGSVAVSVRLGRGRA